jgi:hypothetical protein
MGGDEGRTGEMISYGRPKVMGFLSLLWEFLIFSEILGYTHMPTWCSLKCLQYWVSSSANDYLSMSIVISFHVAVAQGWLHMCSFTFFGARMMNLICSCSFLGQ